MMQATNSLSNTPHMDFGLQGRQWERYRVNCAGKLIAVNPGLAGLSLRTCHLVDVSRGGAGISVATTIGLPDHYYLTIAGTNRRIGCAEVYRHETRVGVKFLTTLDEQFLSQIVRGEFFLK